METAKVPDFASLKEDVQADVCVVGAGLAGLSTAYAPHQGGAQGGGLRRWPHRRGQHGEDDGAALERG